MLRTLNTPYLASRTFRASRWGRLRRGVGPSPPTTHPRRWSRRRWWRPCFWRWWTWRGGWFCSRFPGPLRRNRSLGWWPSAFLGRGGAGSEVNVQEIQPGKYKGWLQCLDQINTLKMQHGRSLINIQFIFRPLLNKKTVHWLLLMPYTS